MKQFSLLLLIACLSFGNSLSAQKKHDKGERFRAMQTAFITNELDLSSKESEKFWPIFNDYRDASWGIRKEERSLRKKDLLTDTEAMEAFERILDLRDQEMNLNKSYLASLKEILPAKKLVKLLYVEEEFKRKILHDYKGRKDRDHKHSDSGN